VENVLEVADHIGQNLRYGPGVRVGTPLLPQWLHSRVHEANRG